MSCDTCPQDSWHLHVTVRPHRSWGLTDTASALQRDTERLGARIVHVVNCFWDDEKRNYCELIPTRHFRGSESAATRDLFEMSHVLANAGWTIARAKIEGNWQRVVLGRVLYYESHVAITPESVYDPVIRRMGFVISTTKKNTIATCRHAAPGHVAERVHGLVAHIGSTVLPPIEAAVLDTNPELDRDWLNQRRISHD